MAQVTSDLITLDRIVKLVEAESSLQTSGVGEALQELIREGEVLEAFLSALADRQKKHTATQFLYALRDGDKDDKKLQSICKNLNAARGNLSLVIEVAHVGFTKKQTDGYQVAYDVLSRVDADVTDVLGVGLRIARALEEQGLATRDGMNQPRQTPPPLFARLGIAALTSHYRKRR